MFSLLVIAFFMTTAYAGPTVTLSHGGKLQGRKETFMDTPIDIFLGVRYAKPPVGELRFKKPVEFPGWEGTVDATNIASPCPQTNPFAEDPTKPIGKEDCLTLDITIPGGMKTGAKRPVMVWIHGGGYASGTGISYITAVLAVTGDVIVVSINYRLGVLGFLATTKGTGNYGLWDQRAALLWVKENIEQFGGDPDLVTIFGESAGGGSVSSQMIGQHNDGLFKRGITQSGSAFLMNSPAGGAAVAVARQHADCDANEDTYDCLRKLSAYEILAIQLPAFMAPTADGDFFSDETTSQQNYSLARRFDLLGGVNEQEGALMYSLEVAMIFAASQNLSVEEGVSMEVLQAFLQVKCKMQIAPLSINMCVDFIIRTYKMDEATTDKERAFKLTEFLGDFIFDADMANQLEQHSFGSKSTYGYYFTDLIDFKNLMWSVPAWLKVKADHADELLHMFGGLYISKEVRKNDFWQGLLDADPMMKAVFVQEVKEEVPLSKDMMKMWTNFAKTGNPNEPLSLSPGIPTWPEFTAENNQLFELNRNEIKIITRPNKERLDSVRRNLFEARQLQIMGNSSPPVPAQPAKGKERHDEL